MTLNTIATSFHNSDSEVDYYLIRLELIYSFSEESIWIALSKFLKLGLLKKVIRRKLEGFFHLSIQRTYFERCLIFYTIEENLMGSDLQPLHTATISFSVEKQV